MHFMKIQIIICLLALPDLAIQLNEEIQCLEDWFRVDDICIYLAKLKLNFEQSKNYCKVKHDANRLTISNEKKQQLIFNYLASQTNLKDYKIWIGLNRIMLKNGQSILLWDNELDLYNKLNDIDEIDHRRSNRAISKSDNGTVISKSDNEAMISKSDNEAVISKSDNETKVYKPDNQTTISNSGKTINKTDKFYDINHPHLKSTNYSEIGLINLKDKTIKSNSLTAKEEFILNRALLRFDNRFRVNHVDSHFYITNSTDKWKMSYGASNKFHTICEMPIDKGKMANKCIENWNIINRTDKCIFFLQLDKATSFNRIKDVCQNKFYYQLAGNTTSSTTNRNRHVSILKLDTIEELNDLVKLIEFEPSIDFRNTGWLIRLKNKTSFNHLFEHKPLFSDSCYKLLPKQLDKERVRREIRLDDEDRREIRLDEVEDGKEIRINNDEDRKEIRLDEEDRKEIRLDHNKRREIRLQHNDEKLMNKIVVNYALTNDEHQMRDDNEKSNTRQEKSNKVSAANEYKFRKSLNDESVNSLTRITRSIAKKQEKDNEKRRPKRWKSDISLANTKRSMIVESHFLHEFDCNALLTKFAICSYSNHIEGNFETLTDLIDNRVDNERTMNQQNEMKNDKIVKKDNSVHNQLHKNRTDYQRAFRLKSSYYSTDNHDSIYKTKSLTNSIGNNQTNRQNNLISNKQNDLISNKQNNLINKQNDKTNAIKQQKFLNTFNLFSKLQLAFITVNLLFFAYLCIRLRRKSSTLRTSASTTHVHFDNCDNSLKFTELDY